jgi:hypothetical protein
VVAREAGISGVAGEEMDAVGVNDERPRPVDDFGDRLGYRQRKRSAQDRGEGRATPTAKSLAVCEDKDQQKGCDEQGLRDVDVEEQRVLNRVVAIEEVVQRVQDAPFHDGRM